MSKAIGFAIKWTIIIGGFILLLPVLILRELVKIGDKNKRYSIISTI